MAKVVEGGSGYVFVLLPAHTPCYIWVLGVFARGLDSDNGG